MSSANRSLGRNVHIYNASNPDTVLGGLFINNGVTNASFYYMVEILFSFSSDYSIRDEGGNTILRNNHPLQPNNYYIVTQGRFSHDSVIKGTANSSFKVLSLSPMRPLCFVQSRSALALVLRTLGMLFANEISAVS